MLTLKLHVELTYDDGLMHGSDLDSRAWFRGILADKTEGNLLLHSQEIGDTIGTILVTRVEEALC